MSEEIRINKYLAEAGVCSRRDADRLVESGKVTINGIPAEKGSKVMSSDKICVDGKPVKGLDPKVYLAFYKPAGIDL